MKRRFALSHWRLNAIFLMPLSLLVLTDDPKADERHLAPLARPTTAPLVLRSSRLRVEIAPPGAHYRGSRFDWSGFVTQVKLDGQFQFLGDEGVGERGGAGLSNEFGLTQPIGYGDCAPGEWFPKIGVGLLQRPDGEDYGFWKPYNVRPFPLRVRFSAHEVVFTSQPLPCRGFAFRFSKTISVSENRLTIEYSLHNIGSRPLATDEYAHNFLRLGERDPDLNWTLRSSLPLQTQSALPAPIQVNQDERGEKIMPRALVLAPFHQAWNFPIPTTASASASPTPPASWWELRDGHGLSVREEVNFPISQLALWGNSRVMSPELFVPINVLPGKTQRWIRQWTFDVAK